MPLSAVESWFATGVVLCLAAAEQRHVRSCLQWLTGTKTANKIANSFLSWKFIMTNTVIPLLSWELCSKTHREMGKMAKQRWESYSIIYVYIYPLSTSPPHRLYYRFPHNYKCSAVIQRRHRAKMTVSLKMADRQGEMLRDDMMHLSATSQ